MSICRQCCLSEDDGDADETVCEECAHRIAMAVTAPTPEQVERCAIAAFACDHSQMPGDSWHDLDDEDQGNYRRIARAVLAEGVGR